jgi:chemotaxis protein methyltransferase CheR
VPPLTPSSPSPDESSVAPDAPESAFQQAKRLADRGDWQQAEQLIAVALKQDPLSAAAHYVHALIVLEKGTPDAALAALRRCVFADSAFVLGHLTMADIFARQGQAERARKALETAGRLAACRPANEAIPEGDGLTAGRLLEMVNLRAAS